jgi:hypothetical protein
MLQEATWLMNPTPTKVASAPIAVGGRIKWFRLHCAPSMSVSGILLLTTELFWGATMLSSGYRPSNSPDFEVPIEVIFSTAPFARLGSEQAG